MNKNRWLMICGILASILLPIAYAAPCFPAGFNTINYLPVNIVNNQASGEATSMQQNFTLNAGAYQNAEASNMMNVYIFNGVSCKALSSWLEGNYLNEVQTTNLDTSNTLMYWAKMDAPIGADSSANGIYYFGFASTSVNLFLTPNAAIGAAPQLTPTYAGADNGNVVFNLYANFTGSSLPSQFSCKSSSCTVNDGITLNSNGKLASNAEYNPETNTLDVYGGSTSTSTGGFGFETSQTGSICDGSTIGLWLSVTSSTVYNIRAHNGGTCGTPANLAGTGSLTSNQVLTVYASATTWYGSLNYGAVSSTTSGVDVQTGMYVYSYINTQAYWIRLRTTPPNMIMPSVYFGALVGPATSTVSISVSPNPVIYNGMVTITGTCTLTPCTVDIDNPLGNHLATGTNTVIYSINALIIGTNTFYANSLTYNIIASNSLLTYQPIYAENIITSRELIPQTSVASGNIITNSYIPWVFYNASSGASSGITYTLNQSTIPGTWNTEISNSNSLLFQVSYPYTTGNIVFAISERQPGISGSSNVIFNETFIPLNSMILICQPGLSYATENIQYFPIAVNGLPQKCWNNAPSNYLIDGYVNSTTPYLNTNIIKGSNTLSLQSFIQVIYNQFSPIIKFNITNSYVASPNTLTAFTLSPFTYIISNIIPAAPNTRQLINITTFLGTPFVATNALIIGTFGGTINNHSTSSTQTFTTNVLNGVAFNSIWIPVSSFQNPVFLINNSTFLATAPLGQNSTRFIINTPETDGNYFALGMYLLSVTSPVSYLVGVENISSATLISARVSAIYLNPITGARTDINDFTTTGVSPAFENFQQGAFYYFNVSTLGGTQLLTDYGPIQIAGCSSTPCTLTIPIGVSSTPFLPSVPINFQHSCSNSALSVNTITTLCTFTSLNGTSFLATLQLTQANGTVTCTNSVDGSSGTVGCTSLNTNIISYGYIWYITSGTSRIELNLGQIGTQVSPWGTDGGIIAFILTMVCSLGFGYVSKRAEMFLVGAGMGMMASGFIGFIILPASAIGGLMILVGMIVYMTTRK